MGCSDETFHGKKYIISEHFDKGHAFYIRVGCWTGTAEYRTIDFECMTTTGEKVDGHYNYYIPIYNMLDTRK